MSKNKQTNKKTKHIIMVLMITVATIAKIAVSMITVEEETLAQEYRSSFSQVFY